MYLIEEAHASLIVWWLLPHAANFLFVCFSSISHLALRETMMSKSLHVTASKTELSAGSVVQGVVCLDPSIVATSSSASSAPLPNDALCLELVGREVSHIGHYDNHRHQQKKQRIIKEEHVFLYRQKIWSSQDVSTRLRESLGLPLDDEIAKAKLNWEFSIPLPNDLPPSFSEDIPHHSVVNDPSSKCQVDYTLRATFGKKLRSEPCTLQIRRLIHQALSDVVSLHVAEVLERAQPMLCGLYEQTHQTFVLSTSTTSATGMSELVWSPLQQSAVTVRLTDAKGLLTVNASGTYRLGARLVQRVVWQAHDFAILPLEQTWTLEPSLYFKGESSALVDGEIVLPTSVLRESYDGKLIQVQHFVIFSVHQKKVMGPNEWALVGSSSQIPVRIER